MPRLRDARRPGRDRRIELTLIVAAVSVPLNAVCGIAAAWCIGRFQFRGRSLLITLIELPFSVSPVISGLVWVLLFGANGWFGPMLDRAGMRIIFAVPGLILATAFVTFPFVARDADPADAGAGRGRGRGRAHPRRHGLADVLARHAAQYPLGRCSTASCCATPAPWASSAPSRWYPATCAGRP